MSKLTAKDAFGFKNQETNKTDQHAEEAAEAS